MSIHDDVMAALDRVPDTCSIFNGTDLTIVDMGLVRAVEVRGSTVSVRLGLTDPACAYFFEIGQRIRAELLRHPGIEAVRVESVVESVWTPERMTEDGRARLEQRRRERFRELETSGRLPGVQP